VLVRAGGGVTDQQQALPCTAVGQSPADAGVVVGYSVVLSVSIFHGAAAGDLAVWDSMRVLHRSMAKPWDVLTR